jgi:hypothetical protein
VKRTNLSLPREFTPDELQAKANELALVIEALDKLEEDKAQTSKEFSETIKSFRSRMNGLAKAIRTRGETRLVECVVRMNCPNPLEKSTVRLDTGELVKTEPMTQEERQERLFEKTQEEIAVIDEALLRMLAKTEEAAKSEAPESDQDEGRTSE